MCMRELICDDGVNYINEKKHILNYTPTDSKVLC